MSLKADFTQDFVRDQWYAAAWSTELGDRPLARHILGERVVFFRQPDGVIGALEDRCPHRMAPLSMGECADGGKRGRMRGDGTGPSG